MSFLRRTTYYFLLPVASSAVGAILTIALLSSFNLFGASFNPWSGIQTIESDTPVSGAGGDESISSADSSQATDQWGTDDGPQPLLNKYAAGTESGFPAEKLEEARELSESLRASVVQVFWRGDFGSSQGTGFLVQPNIILTNEHVVAGVGIDGADLIVRSLDGREQKPEIIAENFWEDLALLKVPEPINGTPLRFSSNLVQVGEPVIAIGHPTLIGNWETMAGVIASTSEFREAGGDGFFLDVRTTLPGSGGASGSPILRLDGTVVGILSSHALADNNPDSIPSRDVFVHTFQPTRDNFGGASSLDHIEFANESGVSLDVVN